MKVVTSLFTIFLFTTIGLSQEICDNAIDDDGDGKIDLNDTDCVCKAQISGNVPSIIPNPSFEEITDCPETYSLLEYATPWVQASEATSDLFHNCDFMGAFRNTQVVPFPDGEAAAGFYGMVGYSEYLGACITNDMIAGKKYTLEMSVILINLRNNFTQLCENNFPTDSINLELYGYKECGNFPLPGTDCPTKINSFYQKLASTKVSTSGTGFEKIAFHFTPTYNIKEIIIGPPCEYPVGWPDTSLIFNQESCLPYFVADHLILNETEAFVGFSITRKGQFCNENLILTGVPIAPGGTFQWYKDKIAIVGQNQPELKISELDFSEGNYLVTYRLGSDCFRDSIELKFEPASELTVNSGEICEGKAIVLKAGGMATYSWSPAYGLSKAVGHTVIAQPNVTTEYTIDAYDTSGCYKTAKSTVIVFPRPDDISMIINPQKVTTEVTFNVFPVDYQYTWVSQLWDTLYGSNAFYTFNFEQDEFLFKLIVQNEYGCVYEKPIAIQLAYDVLVYVPNAFTNDGNELNERLTPIISKKLDATNYDFTIYNRWGQVVYNSKDYQIGWDGSFKGGKAPSGIYTWVIKLGLKENGDVKKYSGQVQLVR